MRLQNWGRDEHVPPMIKVIGKSAAEKSEGIFKAEDWQCKACGNVNWARRQACNRCNTSKFDEVNMISPDEVFDDDNMSVHSSLSCLVAPPGMENDSGFSSDELDSTGAKKPKSHSIPKWFCDAMKEFEKVNRDM
ncbi:uncharacterized protein LOC103506649 [Diaphorina citri]|uniref:Uncharacterized protein LOC103506649 n=1 Tax=Diaphorina citri TaxID=121845 RepID=A0A3Q0IMJ7_DIACI|nr:uncharacterized protein LOC103506649 [Diaphorina citri]